MNGWAVSGQRFALGRGPNPVRIANVSYAGINRRTFARAVPRGASIGRAGIEICAGHGPSPIHRGSCDDGSPWRQHATRWRGLRRSMGNPIRGSPEAKGHFSGSSQNRTGGGCGGWLDMEPGERRATCPPSSAKPYAATRADRRMAGTRPAQKLSASCLDRACCRRSKGMTSNGASRKSSSWRTTRSAGRWSSWGGASVVSIIVLPVLVGVETLSRCIRGFGG